MSSRNWRLPTSIDFRLNHHAKEIVFRRALIGGLFFGIFLLTLAERFRSNKLILPFLRLYNIDLHNQYYG